MAQNVKLGEDCYLYLSASLATTTSYTLPSTVATTVKDVVNQAKVDTPDYTTRENGGSHQYAASLKDFSISGMIKTPASGVTDSTYNILRTAFMNKSEVAAYSLNDVKTVSGAEGLGGNWIVADFSEDQKNGEALFKKFELKPSTYNTFFVVGGS